MPNGSLVIRDVSTEDTGSYTCIAGNSCNIAHTSAELYVVGEWKRNKTVKILSLVSLNIGFFFWNISGTQYKVLFFKPTKQGEGVTAIH